MKPLLLCVVACSSAGCATYWTNRARDLVDLFGLGLDLGGRFGVNVRATQFVQAGLATVMLTPVPGRWDVAGPRRGRPWMR